MTNHVLIHRLNFEMQVELLLFFDCIILSMVYTP
jgi:hypothetical protein